MKERQISREKGITITSSVGIGGNILLVFIKSFIGFISNSISIIMDALNNLTDVLSSLITIIGTKLSNKKPDKKHPFGHGRIEYITSAIIGAVILVAGGTAIYESILSIIEYFKNGTMPSYDNVAFIIIGIAVLIKIILGLFFRKQSKKYDSDALKASGLDALFDAILSLGTLIGALISAFAGFYVEGYIGIIIGIFIIKTGIEVMSGAIYHIIGSRFDEERAKQIKQDIAQIEGVNGVYDLILNNYGYNKYIGSVHVGVNDNLNAKEIQDIERAVNYLMFVKYNTIMTTGIYAENLDSEIARNINQSILKIINEDEYILQLHGFYVDEVRHIVNFDLVFSFDEKNPEKVVENISNQLSKEYEPYLFYINIDHDY